MVQVVTKSNTISILILGEARVGAAKDKVYLVSRASRGIKIAE